MNWLKSKFGRFWPLALIAGMFIIFIIFATKQETLDVYRGGNASYTVETESETEKNIVSNTYLNNDINLSMQIPDGWQHITKDGYDTYVHSASASSIQIQVMSYYPMVNNASADSLAETYSSRGMEITEFQFMSDNSYYVIYQAKGIAGITDYIEYVIWDRQHVAKIVVTFSDENYDKLKDEIWYSLDSITWDYEDPVTDGFYLMYQITGDFEYAVPDQWTTGSSDMAFYAYNEDDGASLTVNLIQDATLLSDITELDYSNFLSNGKANFVLNQFQQSDYNIYGEATYISNDVQMSVVQEYYANGAYQYIVTYEFPTELGNNYVQLAQNGFALTRIFYNPDSQEETETIDDIGSQDNDMELNNDTPETSDSGNLVFTPDTLPTESLFNTTEEQTESNAQAGSSEENEETDSFTSALISITNISAEQAGKISETWNSLGLGTPTYAQAVKESDTTLILMVTNEQNVNYYVYIGKDGTLQEIHVNTDDGAIIYPKQ